MRFIFLQLYYPENELFKYLGNYALSNEEKHQSKEQNAFFFMYVPMLDYISTNRGATHDSNYLTLDISLALCRITGALCT